MIRSCAQKKKNANTTVANGLKEYHDDASWDGDGWASAVAAVMRAETGFPFVYHAAAYPDDAQKYPELTKRGCIVVDTTDCACKNIQRETALLTAFRYASELGVQEFGDILFTELHYELCNTKTYRIGTESCVKEEVQKPETAPQQWVMYFANESMPAENGMYLVQLKDGREMPMLFLHNTNEESAGVWIKAHREWSNMVMKFCPKKLS